jgi:glycosyltransferase involved in cell wall biosynthesis
MARRGRVCIFVFNGFTHDTRVLKQARSLRAAGYDVRVVATLEPGVSGGAAAELHGIPVARARRHVPALAAALERIGALRPAAAIDWSPADVRTETAPRFEDALVRSRGLRAFVQRTGLRVYRRLSHARFRRDALRLALREPADVWLANDLDTLQVAERARRRSGGGLVYDSHELFVERAWDPPLTAVGSARWKRIERRLIRRTDRVVTVCDPIAEELAQRYGVPRPGVVMNVPTYAELPDEPSTLLRSLTGIPVDTPIALYVGAIQYSRPLHLLIEAAGELDGYAVVIVGPVIGDAAASLVARTNERRLTDRVFVLPPVAQELVVPLATGADVGLVPLTPVCLNHVYALPNKLFQYLMAGLPVAVSPLAELSRLVEQHDVGAVFPVNEPRAIAATVRSLLADGDAHARMRANARVAARSLNWEAAAHEMVAAVGDAYERRRPPRRGHLVVRSAQPARVA